MRTFRWLALAAAVGLCFAAPGVPQTRADSSVSVGVPAFPPGRGNPFMTGSVPGIDIFQAVFNGLTELHESGEHRPALAVSWSSIDETTWEFKLRDGVQFSNGEPFTASTVEDVITILKSDEAAGWSMVRETGNIERVEALDATTLRVHTKTPDLMLPSRFTSILMVEPKYWREVGATAFAAAPIGTGPFRIEDWKQTEISLTRFEGAWRSAQVDRLRIANVPDTSSRLAAVMTGALDIGLFMGPEDISQIESAGGRMEAALQGGVIGLTYVLVRESPLSDPRVRQALTYAVNREIIVQVILSGMTEVASQASSKLAFGHDPDIEPFPFDPEKARQLLAEAGYPDGFAFTADIIVPQPMDGLVWQQVSADLARVGVDMTVNVMTFARHIEGLYQGTWTDYAFAMNYGSLPALDPMIGFNYHSCLWLKPWVCDPAQMTLIENARAEFDRDTRRDITRELMRMTAQEPNGLYLYERVRFDGLGPRIDSYRAPFGYTSFHDITLNTD